MIRPNDTMTFDVQLFSGSTLVDPSSLTFTLTNPLGTPTVYTYGGGAVITRLGVGSYRASLALTSSGTWSFAWHSNGAPVAVKSGVTEVADLVAFVVQSDDDIPSTIQFAAVQVYDEFMDAVGSFTTDAVGAGSLYLSDGVYRVRASKPGWRFTEFLLDVTGAGQTCIVAARKLSLAWLTVIDLETVAGNDTVTQLFYHASTGKRDMDRVQRITQMAEAQVESFLLAAWDRSGVAKLAAEDENVRAHAAWIAMELACESKTEFLAADGKGRFWAQYERSIAFFRALCKSQLQSRGELAKAGPGLSKQTGGARRPVVSGAAFTFADEGDGGVHGGF